MFIAIGSIKFHTQTNLTNCTCEAKSIWGMVIFPPCSVTFLRCFSINLCVHDLNQFGTQTPGQPEISGPCWQSEYQQKCGFAIEINAAQSYPTVPIVCKQFVFSLALLYFCTYQFFQIFLSINVWNKFCFSVYMNIRLQNLSTPQAVLMIPRRVKHIRWFTKKKLN